MKTMIQNIKQDIFPALATAMIGVAALIITEYWIAQNTAVSFRIEIWIDSCNILDFFFPLFVSLPFTWKLYFERKDGFLSYVSVRTARKKYLLQKILAGMAVVFVMVFVIYYIGLVAAILVMKPEMVVSDNVIYRYLWGNFQAENPLLFGIFWCLWKAFIGSVLCAFGYGVALLADNIFVIALMPFLYCTIENFITGTLGLERYSICTAYILNRLSPQNIKLTNYYAGFLSFLGICGMLIMVWAYKKRRVEYSENNYKK